MIHESEMTQNRMTPEGLAAARQFVLDHPGACLDGELMLAELDAVTRERDEAMRALQSAYGRLETIARERDEARKDTARLDWLATKLTDPWPIAHSDWDRDTRAAIDAARSSDAAASNEARQPEVQDGIDNMPDGGWPCESGKQPCRCVV